MIYLFCTIIQISPDSREISGDVQKSVILPMLRRTSELLSQKNNKDTCYWFELEFKTGDFVFQEKRRDQFHDLFTCRVLAFFVFPIGTSTKNRLATSPEEIVENRRGNRSPATFRGFSVTGLVCRNVSPMIGVLQISSAEVLFLIEGGVLLMYAYL